MMSHFNQTHSSGRQPNRAAAPTRYPPVLRERNERPFRPASAKKGTRAKNQI